MMEAWRGLTALGRMMVAALALVVVLVVVWAVMDAMGDRRRAAEARLQGRVDTAYEDSSRAAMDAVVEAARRDAATQKEIQDAIKDIRAMPAEQRYAATIAVLCGMRDYRGDPRCAELQRADPKHLEGGRPAR